MFRRRESLSSGSIVLDATLRAMRRTTDELKEEIELQEWRRRQDAAVQGLPVHAYEDERPTLPPPRESGTVRAGNPWERVVEEVRRKTS